MPHNLNLSPDAAVNTTLATLRLLDRPAALLANNEQLVPGISLEYDTEAELTATIESQPGLLFSAQFSVEGPARWISLHIALDDIDLAGRMIFGLVCRSKASQTTTYSPCLRSGTTDGFSDVFFRKTVIAYAEPSLHLDAIMIEDHIDLNINAPWRDLVLFFRPETGSIDLQDLRVFVI
jgi:hypothetical protein